jgi:hypothetical protein
VRQPRVAERAADDDAATFNISIVVLIIVAVSTRLHFVVNFIIKESGATEP